jgi:hypothetical protein
MAHLAFYKYGASPCNLFSVKNGRFVQAFMEDQSFAGTLDFWRIQKTPLGITYKFGAMTFGEFVYVIRHKREELGINIGRDSDMMARVGTKNQSVVWTPFAKTPPIGGVWAQLQRLTYTGTCDQGLYYNNVETSRDIKPSEYAELDLIGRCLNSRLLHRC